MIGKFHNARLCTIDGRDHFIAYLCEDAGKMISGSWNCPGFDTEEEAREWLIGESTRRGERVSKIVDCTSDRARAAIRKAG